MNLESLVVCVTALLLVGTCNIHVMYSFRHAYCILACQPQCSTSGRCRIFERVVLNYVMCAKRKRAGILGGHAHFQCKIAHISSI